MGLASALRQFAQQRLQKGAVIGGWVSSFYLLLPACLTPFLGVYIDTFGQRISIRESIRLMPIVLNQMRSILQFSCLVSRF